MSISPRFSPRARGRQNRFLHFCTAGARPEFLQSLFVRLGYRTNFLLLDSWVGGRNFIGWRLKSPANFKLNKTGRLRRLRLNHKLLLEVFLLFLGVGLEMPEVEFGFVRLFGSVLGLFNFLFVVGFDGFHVGDVHCGYSLV